jgi:hypothetical protein
LRRSWSGDSSLQDGDTSREAGCFEAVSTGLQALLLEVELGADSVAHRCEFVMGREDFPVSVYFGLERPVVGGFDGFEEGVKGVTWPSQEFEEPYGYGFRRRVDGIVGQGV